MEKLEDVLGEDLYKQVVAKLGDKKLLIDDGSYIPDHRFKEKVAEVKALKEQKEKYESDINALKPFVEGNATLEKRIKDIEADNKVKQAEFEVTQSKIRKTFAVKEALMNAGVADADARELLSYKFDVEKIELDEKGQPRGFDDVLKPVKENPAFQGLFGTRKMKGQSHAEGDIDLGLSEMEKNNPFNRNTLNITKQIELKRTNPELYLKLQASANNK